MCVCVCVCVPVHVPNVSNGLSDPFGPGADRTGQLALDEVTTTDEREGD